MNANRITEESSADRREGLVCPECGHSEMDTRWEDSPFLYGRGADAVEISVRLPVRKCRKCGFEFFDEEAEDLSHEAVCRHLGRLTPQQIKAMREKYGFSRADLERLTGLGEASIARWERGELIQNAGIDSLLWLLQYRENVDLLRMRAKAEAPLPNSNLLEGISMTSRQVRVFPHSQQEFPTEDSLRTWLLTGLRGRGGVYHLRDANAVKDPPVGTVVLFRYGQRIIGEALVSRAKETFPQKVKVRILTAEEVEYSAQITFAPSSIRLYAPPLPIERLQDELPEKDVEKFPLAYHKLEWGVYAKVLQHVITQGGLIS